MTPRPNDPTRMPNRFQDPVTRNYLFVGGAAILVAGAILFLKNGPPTLIATAIALTALVARGQTMLPGLFLIAASIASVPVGVISGAPFSDVPLSHFRILDILFVAAVVTYFACQFRLFSLTHRGLPSDVPAAFRKKTDPTFVRPTGVVPSEELGRLLFVVGLAVLVGQLAWVVIAELRIDFRRPFPIVFDDYNQQVWLRASRRSAELWTNRFLFLMGLSAGVLIPAGLVMWYWRLHRLTPAEARSTLLDTEWSESRRELNRQEKWRSWGAARLRPGEALKPVESKPPPKKRKPRRGFFEACLITAAMVAAGVVIAILAVVLIVIYLRA
jgi:hypothetical protein